MHTLIILVGNKRAGKDTVCAGLMAMAKFYHRFALADELKREVAKKFGFSLQEIEDQKDLWRPCLQWYGTEFMKQICNNKDHWCHQIEEDIEARLPVGHVGIVTDCRFLHEAEFFNARFNCYFVKVDRGITKDSHQSEIEIPYIPCDYTVSNYGNLDDLRYETIDLHCAFNSWYSSIYGTGSSGVGSIPTNPSVN